MYKKLLKSMIILYAILKKKINETNTIKFRQDSKKYDKM